MNLSNSIFDDLAKSSLLYASLMGVRTLLERELLLKDLVIASEDSAIARIRDRKLSDTDYTITYPYSYMSLSELTSVKDRVANKNIKRHGWLVGTNGATRATTKKAYVFPIAVEISLHYLDNDPIRTLRMAEALLILGQIGPMVFVMRYGSDYEFDVTVEIPESATIPVAETENTHSPDAQEIEVPLVIHCYAGFFRDVAAVNSSSPQINIELKQSYLSGM